jgi:hypothetical protein
VVLGAHITFKAELFTSYGPAPSGTFRFRWKDNAIPPHSSEVSCYSLCYFNTLFGLSGCVCVCVYIHGSQFIERNTTAIAEICLELCILNEVGVYIWPSNWK